MTRTLVNDFHNWDYSDPKSLECANHPECKYHWKGPGRNMHYVSIPLIRECSCPVSDLVVLSDGERFTTTGAQDFGTYYVSHSGPSWEYEIQWNGYKEAVFVDLKDAIFYVNSKREAYGYEVSLEPDNWTDGFSIELF